MPTAGKGTIRRSKLDAKLVHDLRYLLLGLRGDEDDPEEWIAEFEKSKGVVR